MSSARFALMRTVTGEISPAVAGVTDAHNHVWIARVPGTAAGLPVLDDMEVIAAELADYRAAGGSTIVDCQPGRCGRDGRLLLELSRVSGVSIVACTGVHLPKYYPVGDWVLGAEPDALADYFIAEITHGLYETLNTPEPVCAGFIKIACESELSPRVSGLIRAAASAARHTGVAVLVHTEKGALVEEILSLFESYGLPASRLVLCHVDKRPDFALHRQLIGAGALLEYDTFYRPQYAPDDNLWPLLERIAGEGLDGGVALATDMADSAMWSRMGGGPGLTGLLDVIIPRLQALGIPQESIARLTGGNIAARLAFPAAQRASNTT
jgi:phosphotriesterase-related protein